MREKTATCKMALLHMKLPEDNADRCSLSEDPDFAEKGEMIPATIQFSFKASR